MGLHLKIALVVIAIGFNVVVFWWRLLNPAPELPSHPNKPLPLAEAQAAVVIKWQKSPTIEFSPEGVNRYVDTVRWSGCLYPASAQSVAIASLSADQRNDLRSAIVDLLMAYSSERPENIFDYMTRRGQRLSPVMRVELMKLLESDGGMRQSDVAAMDDRELFSAFADASGFTTNWRTLVATTGCAEIWRAEINRQSDVETRPLGKDAVDLFKNQTIFHHLFVEAGSDQQPSGANGYRLFADLRFVVQHNPKMFEEPSPYYVRFGFDSNSSKWQPVEMIHIGTLSNDSPTLLF